MAAAGESVGGNMTAALALMAKERGDVTFVQQSMYYPVTDAAMNTASYDQFATGYYLTRKAMQWFWDAYTTDPAQRAEITASPNKASIEQVTGRSEEHTSELQSHLNIVCRLLLQKK